LYAARVRNRGARMFQGMFLNVRSGTQFPYSITRC